MSVEFFLTILKKFMKIKSERIAVLSQSEIKILVS